MKKKEILILASVFLTILIGMYGISSALTKTVVVEDKGVKISIETTASNVDGLVKKAGLDLKKKDKVIPSGDTKLADNMKIKIVRAKEFKLVIDGEEKLCSTTNKLISDVLKEYEVSLGEFDMVSPSLNSVINRDDVITVTRVEKVLCDAEEVIEFPTIVRIVSDLKPGEINKISTGENGIKKVSYEVVKEDGVEISRYAINEEVVKDAEPEIVEKGIDKLYVTSRGKPFRYKETIIMKSSAYDLSVESCGKTPSDPGYGITYTGTRARPGVIAVDPKVIPLGSKVYVESTDGSKDYGFAIAEDTGSAIKGNRVDLFIGDRSSALNYGRRTVKVYVIEDPVENELIKGYGK